MVHRAGALVVTVYWLGLLWSLVKQGVLSSRKAMHFVGLLTAQIGFGYANVVYAVPDSLAFIHHTLGVLMLLYAWSIAYATAVEYEEVSYGSVKHA
jgi:heme A synthase